MTILFNVVLVTIVSLTVVIIVAFIYFGVQRRRIQKQQINVDRYIRAHQGMWYDYLVEGKALAQLINITAPHELLAIETLLFSYIRNVSDTQTRQRVSDFATTYLQNIYRKRLKSRRWDVRMNTLYRIETFGILALLPDLQNIINKPESFEEYIRILTIFSQYLPNEFFEEFTKKQKQFNHYQLKKLFFAMSPDTRHRLQKSFTTLTRDGQYATIELMGKKREYTSRDFLMALLNHPISEIRIQALKATHELDMLIEAGRIKPLAFSKFWQERLMVARVLETVPLEEVNAIYLHLIQDKNWWVRNEAGRVLSLTREGRGVLTDIVNEAKDPYAVDTSQMYLMKRGIS